MNSANSSSDDATNQVQATWRGLKMAPSVALALIRRVILSDVQALTYLSDAAAVANDCLDADDVRRAREAIHERMPPAVAEALARIPHVRPPLGALPPSAMPNNQTQNRNAKEEP